MIDLVNDHSMDYLLLRTDAFSKPIDSVGLRISKRLATADHFSQQPRTNGRLRQPVMRMTKAKP